MIVGAWSQHSTPRHLAHPMLDSLRRCVRELGVPFCTQVGYTGPLMPSEVGRPIPCIDQVAIDSPDLVIVCRHFGYPWAEEMIAPAKVLEGLDALELPAATRAAFPGGNAARVRFVSGRAVTA